jgi:WD repeat and SOF domain-containing protein 1
MHNLSSRKQILNIPQAHKGKISGICFSPDGGERLLTCGVDRNVKLWTVGGDDAGPSSTVSVPLHLTTTVVLKIEFAAIECLPG